MSNDLALLSTHGIQDPQVRAYLDRFSQVWSEKMRGQDPLVSRSDFAGLAAEAITQGLGGAGNGIQTSSEIRRSLEALTAAIKRTLAYQVLEENIQPRIDQLLQETAQRINEHASGISHETEIRASHMQSLASSINNIWASIGGSTAVIEEGALASATPTSAVADKWNAVVASVTDPNTGNVSSASILEETRAYADAADGTLNAIYSVKASVSSGGQTVVGGFALAATDGAGSDAGPTIDFGVLANKFFIAAPTGTYDVATEYGDNLAFPFVVLTTPTTINGKVYPPGVYMKKAVIGQAAIGEAEIADLAVTNAKVGGTISSADWTGPGGVGWAIVKTGAGGDAWFNNIYARGDIEATSITADTVNTEHIVGAGVTTMSVVDGVDPVVIMDVPSGSSAVLILVYAGYVTDADFGRQPVPFTIRVNGELPELAFEAFGMVARSSPTAGALTVEVASGSADVSLAVLLTKR